MSFCQDSVCREKAILRKRRKILWLLSKKIKVTKMLSFLPEDVFGEIVYDDIAEKVGDFGSDD